MAAGESTSSAASTAPSGLSEFISRVLDQLSLTSWLPAAMLVGTGALLVEMAAQPRPSVVEAVRSLTTNAIGVTVLLVFGVVLAAVVTQAFSFETIRLLEGYWGLTAFTRRALVRRTRAHAEKLAALEADTQACREAAFEKARAAMWHDHFPVAVIEILEDDFYGRQERREHPAGVVAGARELGWRVKASPEALATLDRLEARVGEYPEPHRVLPTRLGNVLRSAEDRVVRDGHDLEGFVMRNYDKIPSRLMEQHDQFRARLDMYCTLVPVFLFLAVSFAGLSAKGRPFWIAAISGAVACGVLTVVSYQAAVASARGYGTALSAMSARVSNAGVN